MPGRGRTLSDIVREEPAVSPGGEFSCVERAVDHRAGMAFPCEDCEGAEPMTPVSIQDPIAALAIADKCLEAIDKALTEYNPDASWHTRRNKVLSLLLNQSWDRRKLEEDDG